MHAHSALGHIRGIRAASSVVPISMFDLGCTKLRLDNSTCIAELVMVTSNRVQAIARSFLDFVPGPIGRGSGEIIC